MQLWRGVRVYPNGIRVGRCFGGHGQRSTYGYTAARGPDGASPVFWFRPAPLEGGCQAGGDHATFATEPHRVFARRVARRHRHRRRSDRAIRARPVAGASGVTLDGVSGESSRVGAGVPDVLERQPRPDDPRADERRHDAAVVGGAGRLQRRRARVAAVPGGPGSRATGRSSLRAPPGTPGGGRRTRPRSRSGRRAATGSGAMGSTSGSTTRPTPARCGRTTSASR
jgi:hypothetical protein